MKRRTRSPKMNQHPVPAVRTITQHTGNKTHLRPLHETPSLPPGLTPLITPAQRTTDNKIQQKTQHTPPPTTPALQPQSKQAQAESTPLPREECGKRALLPMP